MKHCLTLDLKNDPKLIAEYRKWHSRENIWKEIPAGIREVGIREMEIYLFQNRLFMIVETDDDFNWDMQMEKLSRLPRQQDWEREMGVYQQLISHTGNNQKWQLMERIFSLNECF